jgi:predicted nuclease of restriction endonuclease-like (RecB) superfamily
MIKNGLIEYGGFIKEIKELIYRRQYEAMKYVNTELIQLYWEIGEEIHRQQTEKGRGKSVVDILAKELQKEFPGVRGFSARNLRLMRTFYLEYSTNSILQPMIAELQKPPILPTIAAEISWTKNVVIMQKCKNPLEREFYIKMTKRYGWTKKAQDENLLRFFENPHNFNRQTKKQPMKREHLLKGRI